MNCYPFALVAGKRPGGHRFTRLSSPLRLQAPLVIHVGYAAIGTSTNRPYYEEVGGRRRGREDMEKEFAGDSNREDRMGTFLSRAAGPAVNEGLCKRPALFAYQGVCRRWIQEDDGQA